MSGTPKISPFRTWVRPHTDKGTNGDELRSPSGSDPQSAKDRKANLKRAVFFGTVALIFVVANHFGHRKAASEAKSDAGSAALVSLTVSPRERVGDGFSVRFRLSNRGNHSVFYLVRAGTYVPVGQTVARTSPSSEWMTLAGNLKQEVASIQESMDPNLVWIEMPPGGWVDGEFRDAGDFLREHAFAMFLKPSRNAHAVTIVSDSYPSIAN